MRVFDSFIFFNELEILEMRLNILNDVVDYFVLTESPFTVSGNEKPLYYQENKDMFGKFNDKIIHNITEQIPNDYSDFLVKKPYYTNYNEYSSAACDKVINIPIRFQRAVFNRDNSIQGILTIITLCYVRHSIINSILYLRKIGKELESLLLKNLKNVVLICSDNHT